MIDRQLVGRGRRKTEPFGNARPRAPRGRYSLHAAIGTTLKRSHASDVRSRALRPKVFQEGRINVDRPSMTPFADLPYQALETELAFTRETARIAAAESCCFFVATSFQGSCSRFAKRFITLRTWKWSAGSSEESSPQSSGIATAAPLRARVE